MKHLAEGVILVMLAIATSCVIGAMMIKQFFWPNEENEWDRLQKENEKRRL